MVWVWCVLLSGIGGCEEFSEFAGLGEDLVE